LSRRGVEPGGAVIFGEFLHHARARRPLHTKSVTRKVGDIQIALDGPNIIELTVGLLAMAKFNQIAGRWLDTDFLEKLAVGGTQVILAVIQFAFGD